MISRKQSEAVNAGFRKYKLYTGPTITRGIAEKLRSIGLDVYLIGTEHIYIETQETKSELMEAIKGTGLSGFGWADLQELG